MISLAFKFLVGLALSTRSVPDKNAGWNLIGDLEDAETRSTVTSWEAACDSFSPAEVFKRWIDQLGQDVVGAVVQVDVLAAIDHHRLALEVLQVACCAALRHI